MNVPPHPVPSASSPISPEIELGLVQKLKSKIGPGAFIGQCWWNSSSKFGGGFTQIRVNNMAYGYKSKCFAWRFYWLIQICLVLFGYITGFAHHTSLDLVSRLTPTFSFFYLTRPTQPLGYGVGPISSFGKSCLEISRLVGSWSREVSGLGLETKFRDISSRRHY